MRCGCFGGDGAGEGTAPPEPTEDDFTGAMAEATQALEDAVVGINEALQELRYELVDMEEAEEDEEEK